MWLFFWPGECSLTRGRSESGSVSGCSLVSLQFDGRALAPSNVPHDDGVVRAPREQHPLRRVPAQRRDVTWTQARGLKGQVSTCSINGKSCEITLTTVTNTVDFLGLLWHGFSGYLIMGVKKNPPSVDFRSPAKLLRFCFFYKILHVNLPIVLPFCTAISGTLHKDFYKSQWMSM